MSKEAFFTVHRDLPREGPGEPADVHWALGVARTPPHARICDAGCGPGADIATLLELCPEGHVTAIDTHAPFIAAVNRQFADDARVNASVGSMASISGPFDLIWSAGALYFLGVTEGLSAWRSALAAGGAVAFSHPCLFTDTPSPEALAFFQEFPNLTNVEGVAREVQAAGFETIATRRIGKAAWNNYYQPMEARLASLRDGAGPDLQVQIAEHQAEIEGWRKAGHEAGYLLSVVRPA